MYLSSLILLPRLHFSNVLFPAIFPKLTFSRQYDGTDPNDRRRSQFRLAKELDELEKVRYFTVASLF